MGGRARPSPVPTLAGAGPRIWNREASPSLTPVRAGTQPPRVPVSITDDSRRRSRLKVEAARGSRACDHSFRQQMFAKRLRRGVGRWEKVLKKRYIWKAARTDCTSPRTCAPQKCTLTRGGAEPGRGPTQRGPGEGESEPPPHLRLSRLCGFPRTPASPCFPFATRIR